jgi:threonyl-tRNA synthetase
MLHRTLLGSMERFVGTLIEHYAGAFPFWLSPVQIQILPVGKNHVDFAKKIQKIFQDHDFRVEVNDSDDTVGKKIREAEMQKIPYIIVVGDKEINSNELAVRSRGKKDIETINIDKFIEKIKQELK